MPVIIYKGRTYNFSYSKLGLAKARNFIKTHKGAKYMRMKY